MGASLNEEVLQQNHQRNMTLFFTFFLSCCLLLKQDNAKLSDSIPPPTPPFCFLGKCEFPQHSLMETMQVSVLVQHSACKCEIKYLIINMTLKVYCPSKQDYFRMSKQMLNQPS